MRAQRQQFLLNDRLLTLFFCVAADSESRSRSSEMRWVQTVISKGVLADKVAAHTLLIQESPVHNTASLDALLAMVTPKGKKECVMAIGQSPTSSFPPVR